MHITFHFMLTFGAQFLRLPALTQRYGEARVSDFVGTLPNGGSTAALMQSPVAPRKTPRMFDYRADGYGYCYHQAPRLAIINGTMKLMLNLDGSRIELHNRSSTAPPFEAFNIADQNPSIVAELRTTLLAWVATLDPIPPNTMGSRSKHLGCDAYIGRLQALRAGNPAFEAAAAAGGSVGSGGSGGMSDRVNPVFYTNDELYRM